MRRIFRFSLLFLLLAQLPAKGSQPAEFAPTNVDTVWLERYEVNRPNPVLQLFKRKRERNKRVITAVLAFPLPFGIVGLHRIFLGTAPYVPVVYIGTFGGVLGVLPLVDFFVIIFDKDFDGYVNNRQVFMWLN